MMKACQPRADGYRCSMAAYLRAYLPKAAALSCPEQPRNLSLPGGLLAGRRTVGQPRYRFHRRQRRGQLLLLLELRRAPVGAGASLPAARRPTTAGPDAAGCSISDYFGFNHWRSPEAFGSCERLPHAEITTEIHEAAAYWFCKPQGQPDRTGVQLKLQAGFVDGHVEAYRPAETTILEVAGDLDGTTPAFTGLDTGAGQFFIPASGVASRP